MQEKKPFIPRHGLKVGRKNPCILPAGPTSERPVPAPDGAFRGNTDTNSIEMFLNGSWVNIGSGILGIGLPIDASTNVSDAAIYVVDTRLGPVTVTLPDNPSPSTTFIFVDPYDSWDTNPLTVVGAPQPIDSAVAPYVCNDASHTLEFTFLDATIGWHPRISPNVSDRIRNGGIKNTDFTAGSRYRYAVDTSVATRNVTLPANPASGDVVELFDYKSTFDLDAMIVKPNGKKINNSASDMVITSKDAFITMTFIDNTVGWVAQVVSKPRANFSLASGSKLTGTSTLVPNLAFEVNSNVSSFSVNLPAPGSINVGDEIRIFDVPRMLAKNPVTINANTNKIHGAVANYTMSTAGGAYLLRYQGGTVGWVITVSSIIPETAFGPHYVGAISGTVTLDQPGRYHLAISGSTTVTLPGDPIDQNVIEIVDVKGLLGTHAFVVDPGAKKINDVTGTRSFQKPNSTIKYTYFASLGGWYQEVYAGAEILPEKKMELAPVQTADFIADNLFNYPVDTQTPGAPLTMALPASPSVGDSVMIWDYNNSWDVFSLTVDPNGSKIDSQAGNKVYDTKGESITFTYIDGTIGWRQESNNVDTGMLYVEEDAADQELVANTHYGIRAQESYYVYMPLSPKDGDIVKVTDLNREWGRIPQWFDGNGREFDNQTGGGFEVNEPGATVTCRYDLATNKWITSREQGNVTYVKLVMDHAIKNASFTAEDGKAYLIDTMPGPVTVTLPLNIRPGAKIKLIDLNGYFEENALIINGAGKKLNGYGTTPVQVKQPSEVTLTYNSWTWLVDVVKLGQNAGQNDGAGDYIPKDNTLSFIMASAKATLPANPPINTWYAFEPIHPWGGTYEIKLATGGRFVAYSPANSLKIADTSTQVKVYYRGGGLWDIENHRSDRGVARDPANGIIYPGNPYLFTSTMTMYTSNTVNVPDVTGYKFVGDLDVRFDDPTGADGNTIFRLKDGQGNLLVDSAGGDLHVMFRWYTDKWVPIYDKGYLNKEVTRKYFYGSFIHTLENNATYIIESVPENAVFRLPAGVKDGKTIHFTESYRGPGVEKLTFLPATGERINSSGSLVITEAGTTIRFEYCDEMSGWEYQLYSPRASNAYAGVFSSALTAQPGGKYAINTTASSVAVTLPAAPENGDVVSIIDANGTFANNNLTINPNGKILNGVLTNYTSHTSGNYIEMTYLNDTIGWVFTANSEVAIVIPAVLVKTTDNAILTGHRAGETTYVKLSVNAPTPTIKLPTSPILGTRLVFVDANNSFGTVNPVFEPTGTDTVNGTAISVSAYRHMQIATLTYVGGPVGWSFQLTSPTDHITLFGPITSATAAISDAMYNINASGGAVTMTMPSTPTDGDRVIFSDPYNSWHLGGVTVVPNGGIKVDGVTTSRTFTNPGSNLVYIYAANAGWTMLSEKHTEVKVATNNTTVNAVAGCRYELTLTAASTLILPASPAIGDKVSLRSATKDGFLKFGLTIDGQGNTVNYASANDPLRADRYTYEYEFTADGWIGVSHATGNRDATFAYAYERLQQNGVLDTDGAIVSAIDVIYQVSTLANGSFGIELQKPDRDCRVAFFDADGSLSDNSTFTITAEDATSGIAKVGGSLIVSRKNAYVELEYRAANNLWVIIRYTPEEVVLTQKVDTTKITDFVAHGNKVYNVEPAGSTTITLTDDDTLAPVGSRATIIGNDDWIANPVSISFPSGTGIDGVTNPFKYSIPATLTYIRTATGWSLETEKLGARVINYTLNTANVELTLNTRYNITKVGADTVKLPANAPVGAWLELAINQSTPMDGHITVTTSGTDKLDNGTTTTVLISNHRVMRFVKSSTHWSVSLAGNENDLMVIAPITADANAKVGVSHPLDSTGAPININVPSIADTTQTLRMSFQDNVGQAATNPITFTFADGIGVDLTYTMDQDFGFVEFVRYAGSTPWVVLADSKVEAGSGTVTSLVDTTFVGNISATSGALYRITDASVTSIAVPTGAVGDRFAVWLSRGVDADSSIALTGANVNQRSDVVLSRDKVLYYFENFDGLGWVLKHNARDYDGMFLSTIITNLPTNAYGDDVLVDVTPNSRHLIGVGLYGNRVRWNLDKANNWKDGERAMFEVSDAVRGHGVVWPVLGTKVNGSELPLNMHSGDTLTIEYRNDFAGFIVISHSRRVSTTRSGIVPKDNATSTIPTLGAENTTNPVLAGAQNFVMDGRWPSGTIVHFADPIRVLDGVNNYIVVRGDTGQTVNGGASFKFGAPGATYRFVLQGTNWKALEENLLTRERIDVTTDLDVVPEKEYNIGTLTSPVTLTLPDLSDLDTDHAITFVDTAGTVGTHNVTITATGICKFHNGGASIVMKVPYSFTRIRFRASDDTWVVEHIDSEEEIVIAQDTLNVSKLVAPFTYYTRTDDDTAVIATLPAVRVAGDTFEFLNVNESSDPLTIDLNGGEIESQRNNTGKIIVREEARYMKLVITPEGKYRIVTDSRKGTPQILGVVSPQSNPGGTPTATLPGDYLQPSSGSYALFDLPTDAIDGDAVVVNVLEIQPTELTVGGQHISLITGLKVMGATYGINVGRIEFVYDAAEDVWVPRAYNLKLSPVRTITLDVSVAPVDINGDQTARVNILQGRINVTSAYAETAAARVCELRCDDIVAAKTRLVISNETHMQFRLVDPLAFANGKAEISLARGTTWDLYRNPANNIVVEQVGFTGTTNLLHKDNKQVNGDGSVYIATGEASVVIKPHVNFPVGGLFTISDPHGLLSAVNSITFTPIAPSQVEGNTTFLITDSFSKYVFYKGQTNWILVEKSNHAPLKGTIPFVTIPGTAVDRGLRLNVVNLLDGNASQTFVPALPLANYRDGDVLYFSAPEAGTDEAWDPGATVDLSAHGGFNDGAGVKHFMDAGADYSIEFRSGKWELRKEYRELAMLPTAPAKTFSASTDPIHVLTAGHHNIVQMASLAPAGSVVVHLPRIPTIAVDDDHFVTISVLPDPTNPNGANDSITLRQVTEVGYIDTPILDLPEEFGGQIVLNNDVERTIVFQFLAAHQLYRFISVTPALAKSVHGVADNNDEIIDGAIEDLFPGKVYTINPGVQSATLTLRTSGSKMPGDRIVVRLPRSLPTFNGIDIAVGDEDTRPINDTLPTYHITGNGKMVTFEFLGDKWMATETPVVGHDSAVQFQDANGSYSHLTRTISRGGSYLFGDSSSNGYCNFIVTINHTAFKHGEELSLFTVGDLWGGVFVQSTAPVLGYGSSFSLTQGDHVVLVWDRHTGKFAAKKALFNRRTKYLIASDVPGAPYTATPDARIIPKAQGVVNTTMLMANAPIGTRILVGDYDGMLGTAGTSISVLPAGADLINGSASAYSIKGTGASVIFYKDAADEWLTLAGVNEDNTDVTVRGEVTISSGGIPIDMNKRVGFYRYKLATSTSLTVTNVANRKFETILSIVQDATGGHTLSLADLTPTGIHPMSDGTIDTAPNAETLLRIVTTPNGALVSNAKGSAGGGGTSLKTEVTSAHVNPAVVGTLYIVEGNHNITLPTDAVDGDKVTVMNNRYNLNRTMVYGGAGDYVLNYFTNEYQMPSAVSVTEFVYSEAYPGWMVHETVKSFDQYTASTSTNISENSGLGLQMITKAGDYIYESGTVNGTMNFGFIQIDEDAIYEGEYVSFKNNTDRVTLTFSCADPGAHTVPSFGNWSIGPGGSMIFQKINDMLTVASHVTGDMAMGNLKIMAPAALANGNTNYIVPGALHVPHTDGRATTYTLHPNFKYRNGSVFYFADWNNAIKDNAVAFSRGSTTDTIFNSASVSIADSLSIWKFTKKYSNWEVERMAQLPNHIIKNLGNVTGTQTLNFTGAHEYRMTLTGDATPTFVQLGSTRHEAFVVITQDATGGRSFTPGGAIHPDSAYTVKTDPNAVTILKAYIADTKILLVDYAVKAVAGSGPVVPKEHTNISGAFQILAADGKYQFVNMTGNITVSGITVATPAELTEFAVVFDVAVGGTSINMPGTGDGWYPVNGSSAAALGLGDKVSLQGYAFQNKVYYSIVPFAV